MSTETLNDVSPIEVQPVELREQLAGGGVVLVDVREPMEHAAERIAVSVPLGALDVEGLKGRYAGQRIVFHCAGGKRSAQACKRYAAATGEAGHHLAGGSRAGRVRTWRR